MFEIRVPELAESITEGTIADWLVKIGDYINKGDAVVEIETDKVNIELTSEHKGVLTEIRREKGDTAKVGEVIAIIEKGLEADEDIRVKEDVKEEPNQQHSMSLAKREVIASPAARKLAREKGIELSQVSTVDPLGRVRIQDVFQHQQEQNDGTYEQQAEMRELEDDVERIKMTQRRKVIAERLVETQHTAAMLTTFNEIDMTNVIDLRERRKDQFYEEHGVKLGFMSFFAKAAAAALKKYPLLNAEVQDDEILLKKFYHIGVAVAANEGLVVPVIRDVDKKNFIEIEKNLAQLAQKARNNKLTLQEIQGGTFTITNGGVFGSLLSTPILNGSQVAILGMHTIQWRPVTIDRTKIENRPMMYVALSYDHRIIDGKEAVTFLKRIKELIEEPESLLFEA